jgi:hypothetical protein
MLSLSHFSPIQQIQPFLGMLRHQSPSQSSCVFYFPLDPNQQELGIDHLQLKLGII